MATPDIYGIDPSEEQYFRRLIEREKGLRQNDQDSPGPTDNVRAVMVVRPPEEWQPGVCTVLRRDPFYPYCVELSIVGYPGFGVLDTIRGRIYDGIREGEFSFARDATNQEIVAAFPAAWRSKMKATGGQVYVQNGMIQNPLWSPTSPAGVPQFILNEETVSTGRWFLGFTELPRGLAFAETDVPTADELAALGFDDNGDPLPAELDPNGFETNGDPRVTVRFRSVNFLCSPLTTTFETLVDTSQPSPIAAGALAYAARVSGIGLSLLSIEPRVYQELSDVFDTSISFEEPAV